MFNGILQCENTSFALGFITYIGILLTHADHDTLVTGTTNNGGKDGTGSIITSKSSFAQARSIVTNEGSCVFVTHCLFVIAMVVDHALVITDPEAAFGSCSDESG
ncbi:unnamed protein product, partial [Meganyctiphanes norvegica]